MRIFKLFFIAQDSLFESIVLCLNFLILRANHPQFFNELGPFLIKLPFTGFQQSMFVLTPFLNSLDLRSHHL